MYRTYTKADSKKSQFSEIEVEGIGLNPDSAVGPDAEARSKPYVAKPIDSASDGTSISGACALLKIYKSSIARRAKMTMKLHAWVSSLLPGSPLALAVTRFNCGSGFNEIGNLAHFSCCDRLCENSVHGSLRLRSGQAGSPRTEQKLADSGTCPFALSIVEGLLRVFTQSKPHYSWSEKAIQSVCPMSKSRRERTWE